MMEKKMLSAVEYLNQIQEAKVRVRKLKARILNLEAMVTDDAYHLNGPIGKGQVDRDKTGTLIAAKCDAEQELAEADRAAAQILDEVGMAISRIENPDAQDVIKMRYVDGMKYDEIASEKKYSVQRIYQLRRSGIEEVERMELEGNVAGISLIRQDQG